MKKFLAFILILTMVLAVGCNQITDSTENTIKDTTDKVKDSKKNTTLDETEVCGIAYHFGSVADLETYISTGTFDPADYIVPLEELNNLDVLLTPEEIRAGGYIPISTWFDIDETLFERVEIILQWTVGGKLRYDYMFDNVWVCIIPTQSKTAVEYMANKGLVTASEILPSFTNVDTTKNGYTLRRTDDSEVIYKMEGGIAKRVFFVTNGYYIGIRYTTHNDPVTQQEYDSFMGNDAYDFVSALFSDDEQVFTAQIDRILSAANDHVTE